MYNEDSKHRTVVIVLIVIMLGVIVTISWDDIMLNPPDWIDTWYDGPDRWNLPEEGPTL